MTHSTRNRWRIVLYGIVLLLLAAVAIPNFARRRLITSPTSCHAYLMQLRGAGMQWALEHRKSDNDQPTWADLQPYLGKNPVSEPICPQGGIITYGTVKSGPTCTIPGHLP